MKLKLQKLIDVKLAAVGALLYVTLACTSAARADTFGSGANSFDIAFVSIGNPGNAADTTGAPNPAGSVPYAYRLGKFEISEQMIDKANTLGGLGITKNGRGPNKPATSITWNEAARFVNWLNTSTGSLPAYKFAHQPGELGYSTFADIELWTPSDAGYNANNFLRNRLARYFLPSTHEWYKGAYYDPASGGYFDFPTGSNAAPTPVASGATANTAVYDRSSLQSGPADIMLAGGMSPYGTMGQGGNVWEWLETDFDLVNDDRFSPRETRGGNWGTIASGLSSSTRVGNQPTFEDVVYGFRVASLPEPATILIGLMAGAGVLSRRKLRWALMVQQSGKRPC
jgi:hypothetical protein